MNTRPEIVTAAALCRRFEGFFPEPYLCPAGVPTIGFGTTHYPDGRAVRLIDPHIPLAQAEEYLQFELQTQSLRSVAALCPALPAWGSDAVAALVDFTYNVGSGNLAASTLRRKIAANNREGAKTELMKWVRGGGRVLPGLVRRRQAESSMIG